MPTLWNYIISGNADRVIKPHATYVLEQPAVTYTLTAKGVSHSEMMAQVGFITGGSSAAHLYSLNNGTTVSGIPKTVSYEEMAGTILYSITVTLQKEETSSVPWGWTLAGSFERPDVKNKTKYANEEPEETITVSAKSAPYSEVISQLTLAKGGIAVGTYSILGGSVSASGNIKNVSYSQEEGTSLYSITVTLQVINADTITWQYTGSAQGEKPLIIAKSMDLTTPKRIYCYEIGDVTYNITAKKAPKGTGAGLMSAHIITPSTGVTPFTMENSSTIEGIVKGVSYKHVEGTDYEEITLTLQA